MTQTRRFENTLRFREVGKCIYCGTTESLTDEHIIPLSLNGTMLLPKASCNECAKKTSLYERRVTKGFMQNARIVGKLKTRKPKGRPKSLFMRLQDKKNQVITKELLVENCISDLHLPMFIPSRFLEGTLFRKEGAEIRGFFTIFVGSEASNLAGFLEKHDAKGMQGEARVDAISFGRLLAKIAHGYLVAEEGIFPAEQSPILPIILGNATDISDWIGSCDKCPLDESATADDLFHSIALITNPDHELGAAKIVYIKLFAGWGAQITYAVVARVIERRPIVGQLSP